MQAAHCRSSRAEGAHSSWDIAIIKQQLYYDLDFKLKLMKRKKGKELQFRLCSVLISVHGQHGKQNLWYLAREVNKCPYLPQLFIDCVIDRVLKFVYIVYIYQQNFLLPDFFLSFFTFITPDCSLAFACCSFFCRKTIQVIALNTWRKTSITQSVQ